jgi:hypothetical protein
MKSLHGRIITAFFLIGLLSACGTHATNTPTLASEPGATSSQAVNNTLAATDSVIPVNSLVPATEAPVTQTSSQGATVSFANDILPLLNNRCANCHGRNRTEESLNLLSYAAIMNGSKNGAVVTPGDADNSLLVELLVSQEMPKRGPKLTPTQIQPIIDWINQGALDN